jgi:transposase-like protein
LLEVATFARESHSRINGIFPNDESALRLIGALLAEQNETWLERRYLDMQERQADAFLRTKSKPMVEYDVWAMKA